MAAPRLKKIDLTELDPIGLAVDSWSEWDWLGVGSTTNMIINARQHLQHGASSKPSEPDLKFQPDSDDGSFGTEEMIARGRYAADLDLHGNPRDAEQWPQRQAADSTLSRERFIERSKGEGDDPGAYIHALIASRFDMEKAKQAEVIQAMEAFVDEHRETQPEVAAVGFTHHVDGVQVGKTLEKQAAIDRWAAQKSIEKVIARGHRSADAVIVSQGGPSVTIVNKDQYDLIEWNK